MKNLTTSKASRTFGKTIRDLRKRLRLTQEELAEACERHPVYVSELERGIRNPSLDTVLRLCRALNISPADLMNIAFHSDPIDHERYEVVRQIILLINKQSPAELNKLLAIIKACLEVK